MALKLIDCTLRDGGYYNDWDFSPDLIAEYLTAMDAAGIDYVELGFRSFEASGYRGACAYSTDSFIRTLPIPEGLKVGVMMNAAELFKHAGGPIAAATLLFAPKRESPVTLVRFACHVHEFEGTLPVCAWLKESGYEVGINLMQVADRSEREIEKIGQDASAYPLDALYFADSMGSMDPEQTAVIVGILRRYWKGALGVHTHDNMGQALANTMRAIKEGVTWLDSTVTGMGRGPGNVQTEYLMAELSSSGMRSANLTPLLALIANRFGPMKTHYGWGTNTYYYLAGKHGIHPTYIQEMLSDSRYSDADMLAVIEHLRATGGKKFSFNNLEAGRSFFQGPARGTWSPRSEIEGREVLVLATGPSLIRYRDAIEAYIHAKNPYVIALNTNEVIDSSLINARAACHPVRLLADCKRYNQLSQPLICPASMLPEEVRSGLSGTRLLDFGIGVTADRFAFDATACVLPTGLVAAYALAVATSGGASRISIAAMDGYGADDPRNIEMDDLLASYIKTPGACPIRAITPSRYRLPKGTVYQLVE